MHNEAVLYFPNTHVSHFTYLPHKTGLVNFTTFVPWVAWVSWTTYLKCYYIR